MQIGFMPDIGPNEPMFSYETYRTLVLAAEHLGFDSFWVPDHLLFRLPGEDEGGFWDALTLLGALAAITSRITLGPLVACTAFRNPGLLAKCVATVDAICGGGRFILGLGAGWHEPEFEAFGYPLDHRVARFEEALRIIVPLLREGRVDFTGSYVQAQAALLPRGPTPGGPPMWIGGQRPHMLQLAARYATAWHSNWQLDPRRVAQLAGELTQACAQIGRDPATLAVTSSTTVRLLRSDDAPDAQERAITGSIESVTEALRGFAGVGVQHLVVTLAPATMEETVEDLERFAPVVAQAHQW